MIIVAGYTVKTVLAAFVLAKQVAFCCELSWLVVEAGSFALACIGILTQTMNMNIPVNILMNTAPEKTLRLLDLVLLF